MIAEGEGANISTLPQKVQSQSNYACDSDLTYGICWVLVLSFLLSPHPFWRGLRRYRWIDIGLEKSRSRGGGIEALGAPIARDYVFQSWSRSPSYRPRHALLGTVSKGSRGEPLQTSFFERGRERGRERVHPVSRGSNFQHPRQASRTMNSLIRVPTLIEVTHFYPVND